MIRRPAPLVWLIASQARTIRRLRREGAEVTQALTLANDAYDRLVVKHQQALRDAELLAAGWTHPRDAVEFIRTAHDIDRWGS